MEVEVGRGGGGVKARHERAVCSMPWHGWPGMPQSPTGPAWLAGTNIASITKPTAGQDRAGQAEAGQGRAQQRQRRDAEGKASWRAPLPASNMCGRVATAMLQGPLPCSPWTLCGPPSRVWVRAAIEQMGSTIYACMLHERRRPRTWNVPLNKACNRDKQGGHERVHVRSGVGGGGAGAWAKHVYYSGFGGGETGWRDREGGGALPDSWTV